MTENNNPIGEVLKTVRFFFQESQKDVAERLSISSAAVSQMENGHMKVTLSHLMDFGQAYNLEPAVLLQMSDALENRGEIATTSKDAIARGNTVLNATYVADKMRSSLKALSAQNEPIVECIKEELEAAVEEPEEVVEAPVPQNNSLFGAG